MPDDKPHDKKKSTVSWGRVSIWCLVFVLGAILLGHDWDKGCSDNLEHDRDKWCSEFIFWLLRCYWESFKAGIEPAWRTAVVFGGVYGLSLATNRSKTADEQVSVATDQAEAATEQAKAATEQVAESIKQTGIASRSSQAQRYEKYLEMLWHPKEVGIRIPGCDALRSLGREGDIDGEIDMPIQCRNLLVNFILYSDQTPPLKKEHQEESDRRQPTVILLSELPDRRDEMVTVDRALSGLYEKWHVRSEFCDFSLKDLPNWFWRIENPTFARNYSRANLRGADLEGAKLDNAILIEVKLTRAVLSKAHLKGANLSGADLHGAILDGRAILRGANFTKEANLSEANLNKADLREARLDNANLSEANLNKADLREARLDNANLIGADLIDANLIEANLEGADLSWADLSNADFKGDGSDKQAAKNLTPEQIESAAWDRNHDAPKLPDYLKVDVNKMRDRSL